MINVEFSDMTLLAITLVSILLLLLAKQYPTIKKPVLIVVGTTYLIIILLLTLQPLFISTHHITIDEIRLYGLPWNIKLFSLIGQQWKNVLSGQKGAFRQFFGNIILFIPAGVLMPMIFKKTQSFIWALLGAFLFTLCIESLQLILCVAGMCIREFDVDDLILNTFGALIGYGLYRLIFYVKSNKKVL